jgi:integrase
MQIKELKRVGNDLNDKRFSHYAKQWFDKQNLAETTSGDLWQRINKNLTPYLDKKKVNEFTTADLLKIMLIMTNRGAKETANRMANVLRRIYNEILILGIVETNPAQGLAELLAKPDHRLKENFGHITSENDVRMLLKLIDNPTARQDFAVTQALKFMPLVFLRPRNIRFLKWEYIDFESNLISLPASELKTNKPLYVPLTHQAITILKEIQPLTGNGEYVFVSGHSRNGQPLSENSTTQALRRFINPNTGEKFGTGFMTSHGFRHMASTMLNELGYAPDVIELQLAHINKDRIRATYNKAQLWDKRVTMMQAWADYLDGLKSGSNVIPIRKAG